MQVYNKKLTDHMVREFIERAFMLGQGLVDALT